MDEQVITPQAVRVVDFYGDALTAVQVGAEAVYVPLRALTDNLGLAYSSQLQRVRRNEVMEQKLRYIELQAADGNTRVQLCLPLDIVPGWLFGIDVSRVRTELQARLRLYQAECFTVLWNAFKGDILPASQQVQTLTPAEQILAQAEAIAAIARQQVEIERQQKIMAEYTRGFIVDTRRHLTTHDTNIADHEQRLVSIELRLDPAAQITDEQAAEIALGVKNVAYAMGGTSPGYGKVYSELYRRYRISSYKNLPRAKYDEVIAWLSRWYDEISLENGEDKAQD